jgi:soluble lytic murein transglycosylase-like protein
MKATVLLTGALLALVSASASARQPALPHDACFSSASSRFGVDKRMLVAIAKTESSLNAKAVGPANANGSYDMGIMQINTFWVPKLARLGISKDELMSACTNIHVGAWILAQNISRHGATWKAVGAYNATTPSKQVIYVNKVQKNYALVGAYLH